MIVSPRQRLWLILLGSVLTLIVVGLVLQAVNSLRWQLSLLVGSALADLLLLLLVGALLVGVAPLLMAWIQAWRRRPVARDSRPGAPAEVPANRHDAAERQLQAIDQTLARIRDAVQRQALLQEQARVREELERGDLVIVVFGTGSTGKTSLIQALLGELVGRVGAPMGSTDATHTYRLRLRGLARGVRLVDTPGILEAGPEGLQREVLAREQAARADLLLLLVDGDLRASEHEILRTLAGLGKRLLLVLNKCDLRGEQEERQLLTLLRARCQGLIAAEDVIPVAASPQSVPMPGGRPLQPPAEVDALLRRLAAVLHQDGEELLADNILLQSRRLSEAGRALLADQRRNDAGGIIDRYMWIGAGVLVVTPLPGLDLLGTAAVNAQMVLEIGRVYGVSLSREAAQELAFSVGRTLASLGMIKGGVSLLSTALSLNLPALILSRAVQAVTAAWLTRIAGWSFQRYFQQDQSSGDGGIQQVVQEHYDLNRRDSALQRFLEAAFTRVIEPLQRQRERQLPPRRGPRGAGGATGRADPGL
ncbi:MAG: YcjF family protein [Cyanobacteriota bacterium]